ncbi:MAG: hypothetical protein HY834_08100 [Devosia nanyangense]|uniref:Uncharacterized protein n=1 Tax=Devosia nanyangense TaxID=1228055 RepID=A0A933NYQ0_9HYPH|nr:hypothetical protein [Devosia nanyangense]
MLGLVLLAAPAAPGLAQDAGAYGDGWYRGEFWSGEYPNGFTVLEATTLKLRPELSPAAEPSIDCPLPAKATYHPWNSARVFSDGLTFASFTEIDEMEVTKPFEASLYGQLDATEVTIKFEPGMIWKYLAYYGEGAFLLEYDGVRYDGDQGLIDASTSTHPGDKGYDEWLRIDCASQMWGWLFMADIQDNAAFGPPNIEGYGVAADAE